MLKVAICEDEEIQYRIIEKYLKKWAIKENILLNIFYYKNAESFLFLFSENQDYDIIFLDIKMEKMDGIELSKKIRCLDEEVAIVFITGSSENILSGYSVAAINYLIKPIKEEEINESLNRIYKKLKYGKERKSYLNVLSEKENIKIKYDEIKYFVIYSHYINIETLNKKIIYKKKISDLEKELSEEQFVRLHRSYIVNLHYVKSVGKDYVLMDDNAVIPVSRGKKEKIIEAFVKYFNK